jgi:plastocyanin
VGQPQRVPTEAPDVLPMAQRPVSDPVNILITVANGTFVPSRINARVGDTVEWRNTGTQPARIGGPEVSSPQLQPGQSHRVVLTKAGTIEYRDDASPDSRSGTLVVSPAP